MYNNFNVKQTLCLLLILAIIVLTSCCPTTSLHPLSDPNNLQFDERLFGTWQADIDNSHLYLHIGKGKNNYTNIQYIEHKTNGAMDNAAFISFPSFIDGDNFLNIKMASLPEGNFTGYFFVMYDLLDYNHLSLINWDENVLEKAIREGHLKGEIIEKQEDYTDERGQKLKRKVKCVRITDDSEHIIQFIKSCGKRKIFNAPVGTFERMVIKNKTQQSSPPSMPEPRR